MKEPSVIIDYKNHKVKQPSIHKQVFEGFVAALVLVGLVVFCFVYAAYK
ncbi:MAG: hypothetical protein V4440_14715 [Pseudomonadota bacterium]